MTTFRDKDGKLVWIWETDLINWGVELLIVGVPIGLLILAIEVFLV